MVQILTSKPVDAKRAMEAVKAAPQVVKVVAQPPPKPHVSKPPSALAMRSAAPPVQLSKVKAQPFYVHVIIPSALPQGGKSTLMGSSLDTF